MSIPSVLTEEGTRRNVRPGDYVSLKYFAAPLVYLVHDVSPGKVRIKEIDGENQALLEEKGGKWVVSEGLIGAINKIKFLDHETYDPEDFEDFYDEIGWDTVDESRNYGEGTLYPPDEQFRNIYTTEAEQIENADILLQSEDTSYQALSRIEEGTIVYHGGPLLSDNPPGVFFVSLNKEDTVKYGPMSTYRVTKTLPVTSILWDQMAAGYGFDVDFYGYKNWDQFDDDFDMGRFSNVQKETEMKAHIVLAKAFADRPLVIGSQQDEEFGFFPSARDALQQINLTYPHDTI